MSASSPTSIFLKGIQAKYQRRTLRTEERAVAQPTVVTSVGVLTGGICAGSALVECVGGATDEIRAFKSHGLVSWSTEIAGDKSLTEISSPDFEVFVSCTFAYACHDCGLAARSVHFQAR